MNRREGKGSGRSRHDRGNGADGQRSMRTVAIFCGVIALIIFSALLVKMFAVWKQNQFDNNHSFILEMVHGTDSEFVSFFPTTQKMTVLSVHAKNKINVSRTVGIPVDSIYPVSTELPKPQSIARDLFSSAFRFRQIKNGLTPFDFFRLALLAQKASANSIDSEEIALPLSDASIDQTIGDLLSDASLVEENVSVEVVNASGISGIGNEVARMLTHIGMNVISVRTATQIEEHSSLHDSGKSTYTVERLQILTGLKSKKESDAALSDMQLIIGSDSLFFHTGEN